MNATARDFNSRPTDTNGLEDIFDLTVESPITEQRTPDQTPIIEQGDSDHTVITTPISSDHWTLNMAAQYLQVSVVTIRRKLQRGQLTGYKVLGINGQEWRIIPPDHLLKLDEGTPDQTPIIEQGDSDHTVITTPISPDHVFFDTVLKQLADAQNQLQAAVWRNGYLESQIENQREQIKLLTDSQHRPSWWAKFSSWFFKSSSQ